MPEAASQGAGARLTLADEAAALRKTARPERTLDGAPGRAGRADHSARHVDGDGVEPARRLADDLVQQRRDTHVAAPV